MTLRPPVIVVEGQDVGIFESVGAAELKLEAVDVAYGIYDAYDSEGRLLDLGSPRVRRRGCLVIWAVAPLDPVRISEAEAYPTHQEQLRAILIEHLQYGGTRQGTELESWTLKELLDEAIRLYGFDR